MVEGDGLENRCRGNLTEGSNPSLSAIFVFIQLMNFLLWAITVDEKKIFFSSQHVCVVDVHTYSGLQSVGVVIFSQ